MEVADVFSDLPTLHTERLVLRPLTPADVDDVFAYASDPAVARHTTWDPHATPADSRCFVESIVARGAAGAVAPWGMQLKADGIVVGTCGFVYWVPRHGRAEVAYALAQRVWGRGLMTEAIRAVLTFGFEVMRCNRIEGRCLPENAASAAVLEKGGMCYEGVIREHVYVKGAYRNVGLYSVLAREWRGREVPAAKGGTDEATG